MEATVKWIDGMSFVGESGSGHAVVMDASAKVGGRDTGIRPKELVLIGMGGCTSIDVISILKKQRQKVRDCVAEISAENAEDIPQVFTKIHIHFRVAGDNLETAKVAQAVSLSADKYCSVITMLSKTAEITHDFEIVDNLDD